ncbi:MAG: hypothetical protein WBQ56_11150, partial [Candidatus Sulfotelmatobacter sp.]
TVIGVLGGFAEATEESWGGGVGVWASEFSEMSIATVSAMILLSFVLARAEKEQKRSFFGDIGDTS